MPTKIQERQVIANELQLALSELKKLVTITCSLQQSTLCLIVTKHFDFFIQDLYTVKLYNTDEENCKFHLDVLVEDVKFIISKTDECESNVVITLHNGLEIALHMDK